MPGTPGHAATNVIDRMGGLDPQGVTVDGNNAAGVAKGFKMGSDSSPEWFHEVLATLLGQADAAQAARERAKTADEAEPEAKRLWRSSQLFEKLAESSNSCETADSTLTKISQVLPFRPVNADHDFISRNWSWHVGEKARLARAHTNQAPHSSFMTRTPGSPVLRLASVPNMLGD